MCEDLKNCYRFCVLKMFLNCNGIFKCKRVLFSVVIFSDSQLSSLLADVYTSDGKNILTYHRLAL